MIGDAEKNVVVQSGGIRNNRANLIYRYGVYLIDCIRGKKKSTFRTESQNLWTLEQTLDANPK